MTLKMEENASPLGFWHRQLITSRSSRVSLKGALSKLTPPGELESMNPKSMWMMWPSSSINRFELCLSFTCQTPPPETQCTQSEKIIIPIQQRHTHPWPFQMQHLLSSYWKSALWKQEGWRIGLKYLKNIAQDGIASHTLHKVSLWDQGIGILISDHKKPLTS